MSQDGKGKALGIELQEVRGPLAEVWPKLLQQMMADRGIDGILGDMILQAQILSRALEGVKGKEEERRQWRDRAFHLKGYRTMARRVEGRE